MSLGMLGRIVLALILLFGLPGGCQAVKSRLGPVGDDNITREAARSAARLMRSGGGFDPEHVLIVTSFADVDRLGQSSRFGRMLGQHTAAAITEQGFNVVEILLSDTIYVDAAQGEFLLTRDVARIADSHEADAVVVGTYAVGHDRVYVTSKLVRAADAMVLAADNFELSLGPNLRGLLYY